MKFRADPSVGNAGSSVYLKLKPDECVYGILQGEPWEFQVVWAAGKPQIVPQGSFRFRVNIVVFEKSPESNYVMKIWEQGAVVYKALKAFSEDYDLSKTILKITRRGAGTDTEYALVPMPKAIDPATQNLIAGLELHELREKAQPANGLSDESQFVPRQIDDDEIPF